jgi:ABC-type polysaccharide/polyol phosphate export permease
MGRLFASKDFLAGNLFMAFGLLGLWLGRSLESGTAAAMDAGYFPRLVGASLIALGAVLAVTALIRGGEQLESGRWRPLIFVTVACLAFALLLRPLGLVLTLFISTVLARLAGENIRLIPLLLLCLVLIVATVGLFVFALNVHIPLWPAF